MGTHLLNGSKTEMDQVAGVLRVKSRKENSPKIYQGITTSAEEKLTKKGASMVSRHLNELTQSGVTLQG